MVLQTAAQMAADLAVQSVSGRAADAVGMMEASSAALWGETQAVRLAAKLDTSKAVQTEILSGEGRALHSVAQRAILMVGWSEI